MSVYNVRNILPADNTLLSNGIYLSMLYVNKIPPHLLLIVNGKIWGLSVKGKQSGEPFEALLKTISVKKISSLFFQIDPAALKLYGLTDEALIEEIMFKYSDINGKLTCLSPIKDFFSSSVSAEVIKSSTIFDLLPELYAHCAIKNVYHLFMERMLINNNVELKKYSLYDIYSRINQYHI